jgi:hypothetical protein
MDVEQLVACSVVISCLKLFAFFFLIIHPVVFL